MTKTKEFELGPILSVTHDRLLCKVSELYAILNWLVDDNLFTHVLPRAVEESRPWLLRWFPELTEIDTANVTEKNWQVCLLDWELKYGSTRLLPQIPKDDHLVKNPIDELVEMVGEEKVIIALMGEPKE